MSFGFVALYGIPMLLFYAGYVGLGVLTILVFPFVLFYCMVRFTLMFPAIVVEDLSAIQGLKRSWELSQGAFCDIFCVLFSAGFVVAIASNLLVKIVAGSDPLAAFQPLGLSVCKLLSIFVAPFMAILTTVLYFNLRIHKEGMNQQVLARELVTKETAVYQNVSTLDLDDNKVDTTPILPKEDEML